MHLGSMFKCVQGYYRLRSASEIRFIVPSARTRIAERSISFVGPKWFNVSGRWCGLTLTNVVFKHQ